MPKIVFGDASHKSDPKYWDTHLARARQDLWKRKIESAGTLFTRISSELKNIKPKGLNDEILVTKAEVRLGLWAIGYLNSSQERSGYKPILSTVPKTLQLWVFVANVFSLDSDTSPEALFAYQELLQCKPSEKYALVLIGFLKKAEFSPAATDLLETIITIIPNDIDLMAWLCRWSLKSNRFEKAEETAKKILGNDPNHVDANRCLGYLAEVQNAWATACEHFRRSQDWLRLAICCNHLENHSETLSALMKVDQEKRKNPTWLYHAGWAFFKTGDLENARKYWQDLGAYTPNQKSRLLSTVEEASHYQYLTDLSQIDRPIPETLPEEYKSEALLRRGAIRLMVRRDPNSAEKDFQLITSKYPEYSLPNIYFLASRNFKKEDFELDKTSFEHLKKVYHDASIYLLLRGLWLAPSRADIALLYVEKGLQEGLAKNLPILSIAAILWLLSKLAHNTAKMTIAEKLICAEKPATSDISFSAISSSLVYQKLKINSLEEISWVNSMNSFQFLNPISWNKIKSAYYALHEAWVPAIDAVQSEQFPEFEEKLFSQGIHHSAQDREWQTTAEILDRALNKYPNDHHYKDLASKLQGAMLQRYWRKSDYISVEKKLHMMLTEHPGDSQIHHNLAILYTRWSLSQDQQDVAGIPSNLWKRSIGHWAVVLSDTQYWISWKNNRNWIDEADIENTAIDNLPKILPNLLKNYFNECESRISAEQSKKTGYYAELIKQELDTTKTARVLLLQAGKNKLPEEIFRWFSPVLMKEYADENIERKLVESLSKFKLSAEDNHQIRLAFSPLWEIHVLACSGQYETALNKIKALDHKQVVAQDRQAEVAEERIFVLERYTRHLMDGLHWDEAIKQAQELWRLRPGQEFAKKLLIKASSGWAEDRLKVEDFENAVNRLKEMIKTIQSKSEDLTALLAEALARWGEEALDQDKTPLAQKRFEEALSLDSVNSNARDGIVRVYYTFVVAASEKGDKKTAYEHARQMYKYEQSKRTATIFARYSGQYAIQLYEKEIYEVAIQILRPALQLPYDRSEFQLEEIMSEILTNYGVKLLNAGQRSEGIRVTRQAVELDSENEVARKNLRIAGG